MFLTLTTETLPLSQLNVNELTLSLVNRYNHTWPLAIDLVASGRVDVKPLITNEDEWTNSTNKT